MLNNNTQSVPAPEQTMPLMPVDQNVRTIKKDWLSDCAESPDELRTFCENHQILDSVNTALDLVKRTFPSLKKLSVSLFTDPEWGTEKVVVDVLVTSSREEAFAAYDKFVTEWIEVAEWEARKWICLSYNTI